MVLITIDICNDPIAEEQHLIVTLRKRVILHSDGYGPYLMVVIKTMIILMNFRVKLFVKVFVMAGCQPQAPLQSQDPLPDSSQTAP